MTVLRNGDWVRVDLVASPTNPNHHEWINLKHGALKLRNEASSQGTVDIQLDPAGGNGGRVVAHNVTAEQLLGSED